MQYTQLRDRKLWVDGDSTFNNVESWIDAPYKLLVDELNSDIVQYNKYVDPNKRISKKDTVSSICNNWIIPSMYDDINISQYVENLLMDHCSDMSDLDINKRFQRMRCELKLFESFNLYKLLKTMIYTIDVLRQKDIVWGVGRGSCVSSYVLYLIGVHDIDPIKYDLEITEFFH